MGSPDVVFDSHENHDNQEEDGYEEDGVSETSADNAIP
jgi:hypothetical protein